MVRRLSAIIVGGGIGGLTAAIALRQAHIDATVYERAPELGEVGAGIALASNAMKALAYLGLAEQVAACGVPLTSGAIKTWQGSVIVRAVDEAHSFINVCVHRADLHRVLARSLPAECLRLGYDLVGFQQQENSVAAHFANGAEVEGDYLIGADGIHSMARAGIHGPQKPRYAGSTAWRAVATFETELATSESWGMGRRFGIVPIGGGRVYWFATRNCPEGGLDAPEGRKPELLTLFAGWHHPVEALIQATDPGVILRHDLYDRKPLPPPWGDGLITLLGDAAHPTTPNLGQGAGQAMEDAVVLARELRGAFSIPAALRSYEQKRAPRTAYITDLSRRVGKIAQMQNPAACWFRNVALRALPLSLQLKQMEKVLRFDVEGDARDALC